MNSKIQVLYAKSGFLGHKIIADNYQQLLQRQSYDVQNHDVFDLDKSNQISLGNELYFLGIKNAPWFWRVLYFNWQYIPLAKWLKSSLLPKQFINTQRHLIESNAKIIITTHPIATSIVNYLKEAKLISAKLFTTFSDWHIQPFWLFPHVDKYLVPTSQQKLELIKMGIKDGRIEATGILLNDLFYNAPTKASARKQLNIPNNRKVILVMGGGKSWKVENLIEPLSKLETSAYVIVVGANQQRKKQIQQFITQQSYSTDTFKVTAFIESSLYIASADIVISKPGGLTISESFLLKTPLLHINALPGQEEANIAFLKKNNLTLKIDNRKNLTMNIDSLINNNAYLHEIATTAYEFAPKLTPQIVAELIEKELAKIN